MFWASNKIKFYYAYKFYKMVVVYFGGLDISLILETSQKKGDNKNGRHVIIKCWCSLLLKLLVHC
jgi:hypothetical protein